MIFTESLNESLNEFSAGFVLGTKKVFDFIDNNPVFEFHPQEYVNDPFVIAKKKKWWLLIRQLK